MSAVDERVVDDEVETTSETAEPDDEAIAPEASEGEPEPEPEPDTPPLSEKEIEAVFKKLEKEATQHANRVSAILGEEAQDLVVCAMCAPVTPGFYFPAYLDDDVRAGIAAALGQADATQLEDDDEARMCDRCQGHGETLTGSKVPGSETRPCTMCKAKGWTTNADRVEYASTRGAQAVVTEIEQHTDTGPAPTATMPAYDAWQRPLGHELYGKNPVYLTADERARDVIA